MRHNAKYKKAHCSRLHSHHDLFLLNAIFTCLNVNQTVSNNSECYGKNRKEMGGKWFGMHFQGLTSFLETTLMQKLCSLNLSYGWLVADFHKTHLVYLIRDILSCSWPAVFIAGILCCQGKVAEIDNALEGSEKPYVGKESRY